MVPNSRDLGRLTRRLLRLGRTCCAVIGFWVLLVSATPAVFWYATRLAGPWNDPDGDILIVLGGSEVRAGIVGESTWLRSVYALLAYRSGSFRQIVLSGKGVSEGMRDFLLSQGVPQSAVVVENQSTNTFENAVAVTQMLRSAPGRKVLLTSDYHMYRAARAFRRAGLDVLPRPVPDARKRAVDWLGRWPAFLDEALESLKILDYFIRGWI